MERERHIVAIGGGQVFVPCQKPQTLAIDEYIVGLANASRGLLGEKRKPRILFIPTASGDDILYCNTIYHFYSWLLGCEFDHLRLLAERLTDEEIRRKINWADIIYVGGGNTYRMMRAWRRRGVDKLLVAAYNCGKVMCGLSAGAICWFDAGISDSRKKPGRKDWKPILVKGLGLIPMICCPHFDSEGDWRQQACEDRLWHRHSPHLVTLDDLCALYFKDGTQYQALSPAESPAQACRFMFWDDGSIFSETLDQGTVTSLFPLPAD